MWRTRFLSTGTSVLMTDIDVVYLQNPFLFLHKVTRVRVRVRVSNPTPTPTPNPFLFLHKDADIEGTTDGWDDGSAYGGMEQLQP